MGCSAKGLGDCSLSRTCPTSTLSSHHGHSRLVSAKHGVNVNILNCIVLMSIANMLVSRQQEAEALFDHCHFLRFQVDLCDCRASTIMSCGLTICPTVSHPKNY